MQRASVQSTSKRPSVRLSIGLCHLISNQGSLPEYPKSDNANSGIASIAMAAQSGGHETFDPIRDPRDKIKLAEREEIVTEHPSSLSMLSNIHELSSEDRREVLRQVTATIGDASGVAEEGFVRLDEMLAAVARDYAVQARAEIAKLVANSNSLQRTAGRLALDEIQIAAPILTHHRALTDATLLKVIAKNSQPHMMAVTKRPEISTAISHALVRMGDDNVLSSLLSNVKAKIGYETFEMIEERAKANHALRAPLIRREDAPLEMLNDLYFEVEANLRREIAAKFESVPVDEVDRAFQRSRARVTKANGALPSDFDSAKIRIDDLIGRGFLTPPGLATLLREGNKSRTAFYIAFAYLAGVEYDLVQRSVSTRDLDTVALICRGAGFNRALYITLAISLRSVNGSSAPSPEELGNLYESVPVAAAKRALRFWKMRAKA